MPEWVIGLLIPSIPTIAIAVWTYFISDEKTESLFKVLGKTASAWGQRKFGKGASTKIENRLQRTLKFATRGWNAGLDEDDV